MNTIALLGGIYSNYRALEVALADVQSRGVNATYCLGDLGAFGPYPDRVYPLLRAAQVQCIQGNYDNSLAEGLADCQCGYTDPRDNYFARLSYNYTFRNTSDENKAWLRTLPGTRRLTLGNRQVLLCHGSPRKMNEFLWESTSPDWWIPREIHSFYAESRGRVAPGDYPKSVGVCLEVSAARLCFRQMYCGRYSCKRGGQSNCRADQYSRTGNPRAPPPGNCHSFPGYIAPALLAEGDKLCQGKVRKPQGLPGNRSHSLRDFAHRPAQPQARDSCCKCRPRAQSYSWPAIGQSDTLNLGAHIAANGSVVITGHTGVVAQFVF